MAEDLQNKSMNQLLAWAIQHSDPNQLQQEATRPSAPIDPKWVNALFTNDITKMKECVQALKDPEATIETKEAALEELEFHVQLIDNANELFKIGGMVAILHLLRSHSAADATYARLHSLGLFVLSTAVQNNSRVQNELLDLRGLSAITHLLSPTYSDASLRIDVQKKALSLLSNVVAHNERAKQTFVEMGVMATIERVLSIDAAAAEEITPQAMSVICKAVFLLYTLHSVQSETSADSESSRALFAAMTQPQFLQTLLNIIRYSISTNNNSSAAEQSLVESILQSAPHRREAVERVLQLLCALLHTNGSNEAIHRVLIDRCGIVQLLDDLQAQLPPPTDESGDDEFLEIRRDCKALRKRLNI